MIWYIVGGIVGCFAAFVMWRYTSVARGARQRDEKLLPLLEPIMLQFHAGQTPAAAKIEALAQTPATREMLHAALKYFERLDLFPPTYLSEQSQAEAKLVYWMLHPNELQDAPADIELLETVPRHVADQDCRFYVFRYRMPAGHWAGQDWLLGLAGPYTDGIPPYGGVAGAFSRCGDKEGTTSPSELTDWYIKLCGG